VGKGAWHEFASLRHALRAFAHAVTVSASHDRVGKGAIVLLLYERSAKRLYPPYESERGNPCSK